MMIELLKQLFTTYWAQFTLLLACIGFVVSKGYEYKTKKLEINHSLFQQNRLDAVSRFLKSLSKLDILFHNIPLYPIVTYELKPKEIDDMLLPAINDLKATTTELRLYFDEKIHTQFLQIASNTLNLNDVLLRLYFRPDPNMNYVERANVFTNAEKAYIDKNLDLLNNLCDDLREFVFKTNISLV